MQSAEKGMPLKAPCLPGEMRRKSKNESEKQALFFFAASGQSQINSDSHDN